MSDKSYDRLIATYIRGVMDGGGDFPEVSDIRAAVPCPGRADDAVKISLKRLYDAKEIKKDSVGRYTFLRELRLREEFYPPGTPGVFKAAQYFIYK